MDLLPQRKKQQQQQTNQQYVKRVIFKVKELVHTFQLL